MRILITSDWCIDAVNGVVTSMLALVKGLRQRGHDVRILTLSPNNFSYIDGFVYCQASHSCGFIYPNARFSLHMDSGIFRELVAWKPDIIHSQCEFSSFPMARRIAAATGAPIVHTFHTDYEHYASYCWIPRFLSKAVAARIFRSTASHCDALVVPSVKTASLIPLYGIQTRTSIISSGIDTSRFERTLDSAERDFMRKKHGIGEEDFVLLYLGRIAQEKNLEELVEYTARIRRKNLVLMIAGGGPWLEKLQEKVEKPGLSIRIILPGMVEPSHTPDFYHLADAFAMPSTSETQGLCLIEALSSSLPVICRRDKVLEGVVRDGFNGFVYDDGEAFVKALSSLMNNPVERRQMALNAGRTGLLYGIGTFASRMETLYSDILCRRLGRKELAV